MSRGRKILLVGIALAVAQTLAGLFAGVGTSYLPALIQDHAHLAFPLAVVFVPLTLGLTIWLTVLERRDEPEDRIPAAAGVESRNRQVMLERVAASWIHGVLDRSLHGQAMIELGLEEDRQAIDHPWGMVLEGEDAATRKLPAGTRMLDVFEDKGRSLLVLGAPGSGKTTCLLELTRDALARAREAEDQPIPVVFNLSSWPGKKGLADWIVDELQDKYQAPKRVGRAWLNGDQLLLVLDGLDEVSAERRNACVGAINEFRGAHGLSPLIVASREEDYRALDLRLKLQDAVVLQPLTKKQVDRQLSRAKGDFSALHSALGADRQLAKLARTPLMLNILILAYSGVEAGALPAAGSGVEERQQIFGDYVNRMLGRRQAAARYPEAQTRRALTWLAARMAEDSQSLLLLEKLQPRWFPAPRLAYALSVGLLVVALSLVVILAGNLADLIIFGTDQLLPSIVLLKVAGIAGLIAAFRATAEMSAPEVMRWSWRDTGSWLLLGVPIALLLTLYALVDRLVDVVLDQLGWLFAPLVVGGAAGIYLLVKARRRLPFILAGALCIGVPLAVFVVVVGEWLFEPARLVDRAFLLAELKRTFFVWLCLAVVASLFGGLKRDQLEGRTDPGEGLRRALRNALFVFALFATASYLVVQVLNWLAVPAVIVSLPLLGVLTEPDRIATPLLVGFLIALPLGGFTLVKHYSLRLCLRLALGLPWRLRRFLDHAVDRILLQSVGGGYGFVHRLLLEHLAIAAPDAQKPPARVWAAPAGALVLVLACGAPGLTFFAAEFHFERGVARMTEAQPAAAIEAFGRAAQFRPAVALPYLWRGTALAAIGDPTTAIDDFNRALERQPNLADGYYNRALAQRARGHLASAIADLDRALALQPEGVLGYAQRGFANLKLGRPDRAIADFDRAIELDSSLLVAHLLRGAAHEMKGELRSAQADLGHARRHWPSNAAAIAGRAGLYLQLGKLDEAIADYDAALALNPDLAEARLGRGRAYALRDDLPRAVADYETIIEQGGPFAAVGHLRRGKIRLEQGDGDAAIADFRRVLVLRPGYGAALDALAHATLETGGDLNAAIDLARRSLAREPDNPNYWFRLAEIRLRLGDEAGAKQAAADARRLVDEVGLAEPRSLLDQLAELDGWIAGDGSPPE